MAARPTASSSSSIPQFVMEVHYAFSKAAICFPLFFAAEVYYAFLTLDGVSCNNFHYLP